MSDSTTRAFAILLDGPMQSWGSSSRFTRRETEAFPTKSALIGLLAAAAGIDKHAPDEAEKLAPFSALRLTVYRLPRASRRLVRRLSDFHTVGGGYDARASAFDKLSIPRKASGGASANAVITHRTYLNEARFIAAFEGDSDVIIAAIRHLENPVWGVWFGRKTCLPAMPLSPVEGADTQAASSTLIGRIRDWEETTRRPSFPPELDPTNLERWEEPAAEHLKPGDFHLHDQPVTFGEREFVSRPIRHHTRPTP
ncbi:MAG: type I-E CRISPR-associated protein Cas5/CasD [Luteolibacter sp.]|jgi:CRISPR system Cascade subunit CasD|nr:type I-E CRISPR-associated protein Cas5/CasD [Luteolibacter sp.]